MTLLTWNTQLWLQGNVYLPHKNQDQQPNFWMFKTLLRNITKFVNFVPVVWSLHSFQIYTYSRELDCTFSWFLKSVLTWGTGQDVPPLDSSRNLHAGQGALNTILRSSSRLLFFRPLQGKQGIGYHSFINMENQPLLSCTSFQSGWDPAVISCLLLLYLTLQHYMYFVSFIKPLLFMKVGQKIYDRMEGKFLSAPGLLKGKFVKQLLRLTAHFFSFLWNLRLKI